MNVRSIEESLKSMPMEFNENVGRVFTVIMKLIVERGSRYPNVAGEYAVWGHCFWQI
ncbi:MAG: hypothetical protein HQL32_15240 [Planctomycetes bacterium]|nr:hypothetical protein [Planctomycetota bacterium]